MNPLSRPYIERLKDHLHDLQQKADQLGERLTPREDSGATGSAEALLNAFEALAGNHTLGTGPTFDGLPGDGEGASGGGTVDPAAPNLDVTRIFQVIRQSGIFVGIGDTTGTSVETNPMTEGLSTYKTTLGPLIKDTLRHLGICVDCIEGIWKVRSVEF